MQESEKGKYLSVAQWPKPPLRLTVWFFFLLFVMAEGAIIRHVANLHILDARLVYSPAQALSMLDALDASSRSAYRAFNVVDFSFILLYSALLVTWFRVLAPDVGGRVCGWPWLGLLPGVFDLIETTGVAVLLRSGQPGHSAGLWMAVLGTPLKWLGVVFVLSLLVVVEIRGLRRRRLQGRPWYDLSPAPAGGRSDEHLRTPGRRRSRMKLSIRKM